MPVDNYSIFKGVNMLELGVYHAKMTLNGINAYIDNLSKIRLVLVYASPVWTCRDLIWTETHACYL